MSSGIKLDPETTDFIKSNKCVIGHTYKYIIFRIHQDLTHICVEKACEFSELEGYTPCEEADKAEFKRLGEILPQDDLRYIMYTYVDNTNNHRRCFIKWLAPHALIKKKMLYASSEKNIRDLLQVKESLLIEDEFKYPLDVFRKVDPQQRLNQE